MMQSDSKSGTVLAKLTKAVTSWTVSAYDLLLGKRPGGGGHLSDQGGRGGGAERDVTSRVTRVGLTVPSDGAGQAGLPAESWIDAPAESADPWNWTGVGATGGRRLRNIEANVGASGMSWNGRVCHPALTTVYRTP